MADQYSVFNPTVDLNPYATQIAEIQRRQRMAQLLQQQGIDPLESQVVGGRVIPISPWQVLAKGLQAGLGAYQGRKADQAAAELQDRMAEEQRTREAEVTAAERGIAGRMFGERYTPPGKPTEVDYDHQLGGTPMPEKPSTLQVSPSATFLPRSIEEAGQRTRESNTLGEITPTAQYRYDPQGALQAAMTPAGVQAMKGNPLLASMLANMVKPKEPEEFGTTPVKGADGHWYMPSKSGRLVRTDIAVPEEKAASGTLLSKLIAERDALPADSPLRATYNAAIRKETQPSPGVTVNYGTPVAGVDEKGNPVFFQPSKEGGQPSIVPGVRPKPEEMNQSQSTAASFADRMLNSNPTLNSLPPVSVASEAVSGIPLVGNTLISAKNRQFKQAEEDFISAVLRKQSGATIQPDEYERERKKYIPLAGDDPKTLENKRKARLIEIEGMKREAGPSYKPSVIVKPTSTNDIFSQADAILGMGR